MIKKMFVIIAIILIGVNVARAQEATQIKLSVSKSEVAVGDTFEVSVSVKNDNTGDLNIGNIAVPGLENFQQIGSSQSTKVQIMDGETIAITETVLTFRALKVGDYDIGPIELKSKKTSVKSNTVHIKVTKKEAKKSFFKNSKDNKVVSAVSEQKNKLKKSNIGGVLINTIAFILLCVFIFALYKQKQYKKDSVGDVNDDKVGETGEKQANKQKTPSKDDPEFFVKMRKIIIGYLQDKYGLNIEAFTTQEIIRELESKKIYNREELKKSLDLCDRGSFAFGEEGKEKLINIVKSLR